MPLYLSVRHVSGALKGQSQQFKSLPIQAGRAHECQLQLDPERDVRASSVHAEFFEGDDGAVHIRDLGSQNGTFVDGAQVEGEAAVRNHTVVQFGVDGPQVSVEIEKVEGVDFGAMRGKNRSEKSIDPRRRVVATDRHEAPNLDVVVAKAPEEPDKSTKINLNKMEERLEGVSPLLLVAIAGGVILCVLAAVYSML